ncbi:Glycosyl transferase family 2 [Pseudomonas pohangensis]|uniref:Glycosyl transferase family 2 n=1 Tax=Pseudomonas pohangensis TaxID=364197 RepID=A0A1H2H195_9PSED|nr:glycosyltransferase [Pseudomonas pohangensis]SDU25614.1 Glycosyl transferase family 2 [Pseudomonas pohangensis]
MAGQDISKQFEKLRSSFQKGFRESVVNIRLDALYQQLLMQHVFDKPEPLAAMDGWSISPEFAWWLFQHVINEQPRKIIELGSGTSTLVIASAIKRLGKGRFLSFEHNYVYFEKTRALLEACDLQHYVDLIYAPLEELKIGDQTYRWYGLPYDLIENMIGPKQLDFLLVDGPPAATNHHARYPAVVQLRKYFSASTIVLLDDGDRVEEQETLVRWIDFMGGNYSHKMLSNVRHAPALFYPVQNSPELEDGEKAFTNGISATVAQEVALAVESALNGMTVDNSDVKAKALVDAFYRLREKSLHQLKRQVESELNTAIANSTADKKQFSLQMLALQEREAALREELEARLLEKLDVVTRDRDDLKAQLTALSKRHKLVYQSLVYQLGLSFYRRTRRLKSWVKMPLAMYRVMQRHAASGNPIIVEYQDPSGRLGKPKVKLPTNFNPDMSNPDRVLLNANEIAKAGDHALAISLAESHLPIELAYTVHVLRANAAIAAGDEEGWLNQLNGYLAEFNAAPIRLDGKGNIFDRLASDPLPPVMDGPLISIIMPVWNSERTVRRAAESILNQTWRNLELLIVDDCSADGTWSVLLDLAAIDCRVKIFRNKVNVGPYVSKNIALMQAAGDWITGHDADDWALPQRLENHYNAMMAANPRPRASITEMARLDLQGRFVRVGEKAKFSRDGVTRKSSVSLLCERSFFQSELGSWDCVRFGADSETIDRAERLLGSEFCEFRQIGMLCLEHEDSLTGHPELGVSPESGVSKPRAEYAASWRAWHKRELSAGRSMRLAFPPIAKRCFRAPSIMAVPLGHIIRNSQSASVASNFEPVTAICVSRRGEFVPQVLLNLQQQTHPDLRVIYVIHGFHIDTETVRRELAGLKNLTVLQITDKETFLADGLNLALDHCQTDLCAKIDDDDHYGPDYIRNAELALKHSDLSNVALTGKAMHFCYVESANAFGVRFEQKQNRGFTRVHGGTLFWRRSLVDDQRFERVRQGTDSRFTKGVLEKGRQIYSADPYDFVHVRYANTANHTWQIEDAEFMRPVTRLADGLRLDLAYSNPAIADLALPSNDLSL